MSTRNMFRRAAVLAVGATAVSLAFAGAAQATATYTENYSWAVNCAPNEYALTIQNDAPATATVTITQYAGTTKTGGVRAEKVTVAKDSSKKVTVAAYTGYEQDVWSVTWPGVTNAKPNDVNFNWTSMCG